MLQSIQHVLRSTAIINTNILNNRQAINIDYSGFKQPIIVWMTGMTGPGLVPGLGVDDDDYENAVKYRTPPNTTVLVYHYGRVYLSVNAPIRFLLLYSDSGVRRESRVERVV